MSGGSNTIRFIDHKVASSSFTELYGEGMQLVEETAAYLDGEGRKEAKRLGRSTATLYAAESMRLTTRLMQMASWLLLQRALANGEMTSDQVDSEKSKIRLDTISPAADLENWNNLPERFRALVHRSLRLQARMQRMDLDLGADDAARFDDISADNPVNTQINLLKTAFGDR
ncbi:MAG: DUF1465 family protein [Roseitalea sp.]|jgi:regulator of CtrA degradation|uniref:DUF1465 family protein n=1 Tax=Oceaniradius stylonematis TaxID=2184161 RepID=A0A3A8A734_9HYPH|nr:DUF1465 family protein [Oceaniradius stylonematis]MBO6551750.1 DUF1465 family protein [Roseitalea sp.]MBO6951870.1 DUF1465 family protein [Rhizobiaceae bacterium]RNC95703.1 MAG: DUF1465 family protein [Oricola sp.]MBO6592284.1 DUF1465 family protein [Roseitalea sp.]MBO6598539.1 DUF1465 family protein [Roseitalea sp.]